MNQADIDTLMDIRVESLDNLADAETSLLRMDALGHDERAEVVDQIFRAFHTVKGTAGFFDLHLIVRLSHAMENLLVRVREGELEYESDMTQAFLTGIDKLNQLLDALPESADLPIDEELAAMKACVPAADRGNARDDGGAAPNAGGRAHTVDTREIRLLETMSIAGAAALKEELLEILSDRPKRVILDGARVSHTDAASFQLLLSFIDAATLQALEIVWKSPSEKFRTEAELIGVSESLRLPAIDRERASA